MPPCLRARHFVFPRTKYSLLHDRPVVLNFLDQLHLGLQQDLVGRSHLPVLPDSL